jgi:SAM-dependent methyltransferase
MTTSSDFYEKFPRGQPEKVLKERLFEIKSNGLLGVLFSAIRKETSMRKIQSVADFGGYSGMNMYLLKKFVDYDQGILLDICPVPFSPEFKVIKCDLQQRIPLPDNSVDLALLIEVIEHLFDTDNLIVEIRRILKRNGLVAISTMNLASIFNRFLLMSGKQPLFTEVSTRKIFGRPGQDVVGHIRVFTYGALRDFLSYYGFRIRFMTTVPLFLHENSLVRKVASKAEKIAIALDKSMGSRIAVIAESK